MFICFFLDIGPACSIFIGGHYAGTCGTRGSNPRLAATSLGGVTSGPQPSPLYVQLLIGIIESKPFSLANSNPNGQSHKPGAWSRNSFYYV
jgi:hypothetical protein